MTGFGSAEGALSVSGDRTVGWRWELRGVNGKTLDLKLRIPQGHEALDQKIRPLLTGKVARGTIHAGLTLERGEAGSRVGVDEAALATVIEALGDVQRRLPCSPPTADGILALRGVLITTESRDTDEDRAAIEAAVIAGFGTALDTFIAARNAEGAQLAGVFAEQLDEMEALITRAKAEATTALPHHLNQMRQKIRELIGGEIPDERTEQEAVLLAVKSDIREELDRFDGHLEAARSHLSEGGVIGRKLDFLAQEYGREANTLTSKAWTLDLKRIGLDLKLLVDRFREQVQNIE